MTRPRLHLILEFAELSWGSIRPQLSPQAPSTRPELVAALREFCDSVLAGSAPLSAGRHRA